MAITGFEDGRGPQTREDGQPLEDAKGKKPDSLLEPPERNTSVPTP